VWQGFATVSLASFSGDSVAREWYNILSSKFMILDSASGVSSEHCTNDTVRAKQVVCVYHIVIVIIRLFLRRTVVTSETLVAGQITLH